jgi:hemoglobin/transferrin/lactoferrin receptor protein
MVRLKIKMMRISVFLILLVLIEIPKLNAQIQDAKDSVSSRVINLNEIVFSVNKIGETKKAVAQHFQVLTAREIVNSQSQTTADVLSNLGNVAVQKSQLGGGDINIRGFDANQNVLVIDGVRMNNLIYRGGHLQDIIKTDNAVLDRIEILFGPSSTIYGSDALGGVIHLFTKSPLLASGVQNQVVNVNVMSRFGTADHEATNHIDFNIGTRRFASLTSFSHSDFGDLMGGKNQNPFYGSSYGERPFYAQRFGINDSLVKNDNRFLQRGSGYSQSDLLQKILFRQNQYLTHCINIQYSTSGNVPRYDRLTDPLRNGLKSAEWYYGPQNRLLTAYDMNLANPRLNFQNIHFGLNFQSLDESRHNRNFGSVILKNRIEQVGVLGANLDFQKIVKEHNIRFGGEMQLNNLKSTAHTTDIITRSIAKLDTRFPDGVNRMNNLAAYYSHTWKISEQLILNDGVRVGYSAMHSTLVDLPTQFNLPYHAIDQKTPVYSGSLGLNHSPSDHVKFSFLVSTGYRIPNIDDMSKIFAPSPGEVIVPNVSLKPERTINYEIGMTRLFTENTRWESSVYYTQFVDAVVTSADTFNGKDSILYDGFMCKVVSNQNKSKAYIYGFSSNLISRFSNKLTISAMVNYTYGRIKATFGETPLNHIAPFMARGQIAYADRKFSSEFFVSYNGWKRAADYCSDSAGEDNLNYATPLGMPAWCTLNLRGSWKISKTITFQSGIDNILDTQYRTFASGINGSGRNLFISLRGNF